MSDVWDAAQGEPSRPRKKPVFRHEDGRIDKGRVATTVVGGVLTAVLIALIFGAFDFVTSVYAQPAVDARQDREIAECKSDIGELVRAVRENTKAVEKRNELLDRWLLKITSGRPHKRPGG